MPPIPEPKQQRAGSTLFVTIVVVIVIALAAFLILHPKGSDSGGATTKTTQH